jgi:site-specific recombinase XerD
MGVIFLLIFIFEYILVIKPLKNITDFTSDHSIEIHEVRLKEFETLKNSMINSITRLNEKNAQIKSILDSQSAFVLLASKDKVINTNRAFYDFMISQNHLGEDIFCCTTLTDMFEMTANPAYLTKLDGENGTWIDKA